MEIRAVQMLQELSVDRTASRWPHPIGALTPMK
jgi:hypothetical protein